ncbi:hypothetical protein FRB93_001325 [Tulasnella sp. JGI-2019a]|nr:hypothetical protein FRB93_001325 [Tulasnella sp. JGI-2019a]
MILPTLSFFRSLDDITPIDPELKLSMYEFEGEVKARYGLDALYISVDPLVPVYTFITGDTLPSSIPVTTPSSGMGDEGMLVDVDEWRDGETSHLPIAFHSMAIAGDQSVEPRIGAPYGLEVYLPGPPQPSLPSFHAPCPRSLPLATALDPVCYRPRKPSRLPAQKGQACMFYCVHEDRRECSMTAPFRTKKSAFEEHLRSTSRVYRYRCPHCNIGSNRNYNIKRHFKTCVVLKAKAGSRPPLDTLARCSSAPIPIPSPPPLAPSYSPRPHSR